VKSRIWLDAKVEKPQLRRKSAQHSDRVGRRAVFAQSIGGNGRSGLLESCSATGPVFAVRGAARRSGLGEGGRKRTGSNPGAVETPRYFDAIPGAPRREVAGALRAKSAGPIRCRTSALVECTTLSGIPLRAGARTLVWTNWGYSCPQVAMQIDWNHWHAQRGGVALAVRPLQRRPARGELASEELRSLAPTFRRAIYAVFRWSSILHRLPARAASHASGILRWAGPRITHARGVLGRPGSNGARSVTEPVPALCAASS